MIRKLLNSKKGEGYLDVVVGVVALAMFIVVALNIFTFVSLKTTMDRIADDLIEVATYSGAFGEDFDLKVDQLKAKYFDFDVEVYTEEYFNAEHKRVQMGEDMGITIKVNSSVAGIDIALPVDLTVSRVGQSEQYWRVASGVYEEPEIDYTGKTLFVLNTSTGKFHYPHCSLVQSMKEENRKEVYSTAEELTALGYSPCGTCDAHDCSTNVVTHFNIYGHWGYCETCGRQDEIEKHWWTYDEKLDQYYCEYCEAIENKDGNYACSNGSLLTEAAHPMGCGCHLTPPTLTVNGLSTDSANPTILEQTGTIRITGIAKDREGAVLAVNVNGAKAQLFSDGEWYYDLDFNNTTGSVITVTAIDEDGMETTVNCYAELPVTLITITAENKYEIMDAIGVDYTLTGYPLTIPEYYFIGDTKYKIVGIGDYAFDCEEVGDVYITGENRSYFTIGEAAFADSSIYRIRFDSDKIKEIGSNAFNMSDIEYAYLPNADFYGQGIFSDCEYLKEVELPSDLTYISPYMFINCYELKTIDLKNVKEIYEYAFMYSGINSINLSNVKMIGPDAFYNSKLTSVTIPVVTWHAGAFAYCESLETVTIAQGNTYIPERAFSGCVNLKAVHMSEHSPQCEIAEIGAYAFYDCTSLPTTWTFLDSVTTIGDYSFYHCYGITEFVFGKNVAYIGEDAFYVEDDLVTTLSGTISGTVLQYDWANSYRIIGSFPGIYYEDGDYVSWEKAIELGYISVSDTILVDSDGAIMFNNGNKPGRIMIPDNIAMVNHNAFASCAGLTSFVTSKSSALNWIGEGAFAYCYNLESVVLSDNVKLVDSGAFAGCSSLDSITLPQNLESIGDYSFSECNLSEIVIPSKVTYIGSNAFSYNESLAKITFDKAPSTIGTDVFLTSNNIETYVYGTLSDAVHDYDWVGSNRYTGATVTINSTNKEDAGYKNGIETLNIRDVYIDYETNQIVKPIGIASSAFSTNEELITVNMPTTIIRIYAYAFYGCISLESVTGMENVETIDSNAFRGCNSLKKITAPNAEYIGAYAFYGCTSLSDLSISDAKSIGDYAFFNCTGLNSANLGIGLISIGNHAFDGCTALLDISFPGTLKTIGADAFQNCTRLKNITIPSSVTSVGTYAFQNCTGLNQLNWQAACAIPAYCFQSASITSINILNATAIETGAFSNAIKGGSVKLVIPTSVTRIGDYAFTSCIGISQVSLGYRVETIGAYAFQHCSAMKTFNIGAGSSLTTLGEGVWAYSGLTSMTTLGNARQLSALPNKAFYYSELSSVTIPVNIKKIGTQAFAGCTKLTGATLEEDESLSLVASPWYVSTSSSATSGTSIMRIQAINTSQAANLLRNTYVNYYWFRRSA